MFYRGVKISITIARFYLTVKHEAEEKLTDGTGHKPHYRSVSIQFLINNLKVKLLLFLCFTWNLLISQPFKCPIYQCINCSGDYCSKNN